MVVHSAYMLINKSIPSTGGPYTVRFYDEDGELIQTDTNIPQYGKAHCTLLDGSINGENQYFKGWNPAPDPVMRDMDCYPVYGDYVINYESINDSWDAICLDNGAHYPLLAHKTLTIEIPKNDVFVCSYKESSETWYTSSRFFANIEMIKVGEAEDGTTSTWLSMSGISMNMSLSDTIDGNRVTYVNEAVRRLGVTAKDWGVSDIRQFMNDNLLGGLPLSLQTHIKQVDKKWQGFTDHEAGIYSDGIIGQSSLDKIWVPSRSELKTFDQQLPVNITNCNKEITFYEGMDYSLIFTPTWGGVGVTAMTRDACFNWGNNGVHYRWFYGYRNLAEVVNDNANTCVPFGFCL